MDDQRDEDCYIFTRSEFESNINKKNEGIQRATHQAITQDFKGLNLEGIAALPPALRTIIFQYAITVPYTLDERDLTHIVTSQKRSLLYPRCLPSLLQTSYEFRSTLFRDFLKVNEVHMDALGKLREAIDDYEEEEGLHSSEGGTLHVRHAVVGEFPPGPTEEQFAHQMKLLAKCKSVRTVAIMNYSRSKTEDEAVVAKLIELRHLRKVTMVQDALTIGKARATAFEQRVIKAVGGVERSVDVQTLLENRKQLRDRIRRLC